jgi:L-xylulokinase
MSLLLGIDVGSTFVKAVLFDRKGAVVAQAAAPVPVVRPHAGWVERDAEQVWRAVCSVVRHCVRRRVRHVGAVGVTGCGNGAVFLDARLRPVRRGILSSDTRAARRVRTRAASPNHRPYPGQLPFLLRWLEAEEPARFRRLRHAVFWKDFVRARLTGRVATDVTDAGAAGLLSGPDLALRSADDVLPPVLRGTEQAGTVVGSAAECGLRAGTPVFAGCIDCEAGAIGSGVAGPGEVSMIAGTWSINQCYATRRPRERGHFLVNPATVPGRWLILEGSPSSAANFDWAIAALSARPHPAAAAAEGAGAGRSGLIFLPRVADGSAAFLGLEARHRRPDLLRAVMEGVVFAHRAHLERLRLKRVRRVVLAGGVSGSAAWCQMFADGLGCRVDVPAGAQMGALGAAIIAGVGSGVWRDIASAQRAMVPAAATFRPDPSRHRAMTRSYRQYRRHLATLFHE